MLEIKNFLNKSNYLGTTPSYLITEKNIHEYILFNNNIIVETLINIRNNFWPGCDSSLDILYAISFISQFKKE